MTRSLRAWAAALAAVLLAGCASGYRLDNRVQAFSSLPALPASPTYRFERLPSQLAGQTQEQVERLADPALFKVGLRRDDASPKFGVQVSARVQRTVSPWADAWDPYGWGGASGLAWAGPRYGWGFGVATPLPRAEPWYHREVAVIVTDLASHKVVFESRAANEGPLMDDTVVLATMFDAAMQGFPDAPQGPRRISVQIGGKEQPAAQPAAPAASAPQR